MTTNPSPNASETGPDRPVQPNDGGKSKRRECPPHSPLPWFIHPIKDFITIQCGPRWVAELNAYKDGPITFADLAQARSDAEFIVSAVNSHHRDQETIRKLREQVSALTEELTANLSFLPKPQAESSARVGLQARAVLAETK